MNWLGFEGRYKVRCDKLLDPVSPERIEGSQPNFMSRSRGARSLQGQLPVW